MVQVLKATPEHAEQLAPILRAIDVSEVKATNPSLTPKEVLMESLRLTKRAYAVVDEGRCLAMFGVTPLENNVGVPWLLSSDRFFELHSDKFARQCRKYLKEMSEGYHYLFNFIAVDNSKCQRWLSWLGFHIHTETVIEFNGKPFYKFDNRK
jgi:hypothetical protein